MLPSLAERIHHKVSVSVKPQLWYRAFENGPLCTELEFPLWAQNYDQFLNSRISGMEATSDAK